MPNTPYFDPQTALPDPSVYTMHGPFGQQAPSFLGYQAAANRRETMAPFLQRAGQEDSLNLHKLQQDTSEYMSPSGMGQRLAGRQAATAQSQKTAATAPLEQQLQTSQLGGQIASQPILNATQLEKARQELSTQKGQPSEHAMQIMANMYPAIKSAGSDIAKQLLHAEAVKRFQSKYPDEPIPDNLKTWNPGMERMYQAASEVAVSTPEFRQKMAEGAQTQAGQTQREGMSQTGQTQRTEMGIEAGKTAAIRVAKIKSLLANPKTTDAQKESLQQEHDVLQRQLVDDHLDKELGKLDPAMLTILGQKYVDAHMAAKSNARVQMMIQRGVPLQMSDLRAISPGKSDEEIRAQAKKRNIKLSD